MSAALGYNPVPQESKMKIRTDDHTIIEGTPAELVARLNKDSRAHAKTCAAYMEQAADRATMTTGIDVRYDTPENFIADLAKSGLVDIVDDKTGK
jgi:hypothetical protein